MKQPGNRFVDAVDNFILPKGRHEEGDMALFVIVADQVGLLGQRVTQSQLSGHWNREKAGAVPGSFPSDSFACRLPRRKLRIVASKDSLTGSW